MAEPAAVAESAPLMAAVERGTVCLVSRLDADLHGNKGMLALLSDDRHRDRFDASELALLDRFLPWTRLARARVTDRSACWRTHRHTGRTWFSSRHCCTEVPAGGPVRRRGALWSPTRSTADDLAAPDGGATLTIVCVDDYRAPARARLAAHNWDYIEGGSGAELTLDANRQAFDAVHLKPRVLVDVSACSSALQLLGADLATPIGVAPTAFHRMAHPDGECATARGAGAAGALTVVSMFSSRTLEEVAAAAHCPLWMQLYWLRDRRQLADLAQRAERAGYRALVLTVDTPQLAQRRRDVRNAFVLDPDIEPANLPPVHSAAQHHRQEGRSALAQHAAQSFDASITWADLAWLREITALPLVVKGILTAEDARLAVEHGAAGVIVSNHGGRQLDGAVPSLVALPEVVAAVAGRCPVLVDGSVRSGRDVFVALALGAGAVLVGRPVLWGLAVSGAEGVADVLTMLNRELTEVMALAGRPRLTDIDRSAIR